MPVHQGASCRVGGARWVRSGGLARSAGELSGCAALAAWPQTILNSSEERADHGSRRAGRRQAPRLRTCGVQWATRGCATSRCRKRLSQSATGYGWFSRPGGRRRRMFGYWADQKCNDLPGRSSFKASLRSMSAIRSRSRSPNDRQCLDIHFSNRGSRPLSEPGASAVYR